MSMIEQPATGAPWRRAVVRSSPRPDPRSRRSVRAGWPEPSAARRRRRSDGQGTPRTARRCRRRPGHPAATGVRATVPPGVGPELAGDGVAPVDGQRGGRPVVPARAGEGVGGGAVVARAAMRGWARRCARRCSGRRRRRSGVAAAVRSRNRRGGPRPARQPIDRAWAALASMALSESDDGGRAAEPTDHDRDRRRRCRRRCLRRPACRRRPGTRRRSELLGQA